MCPIMSTFSFSLDSSSKGYHKYQNIWRNPTVDDELICKREVGNPHNTHAVAIKKAISGLLTTVGHAPRTISNSFYKAWWHDSDRVNGHRCYSADLEQGGLEIPCILTYSIEDGKKWAKTKQTIDVKLGISTADSTDDFVNLDFLVSAESLSTDSTSDLAPPAPMDSSVSIMDLTAHCSTDDQSPPKKKAKSYSEEDIVMDQELSDVEINFTQDLLKMQYPKVSGLQSTLFQEKRFFQVFSSPTVFKLFTAKQGITG